MFGSICRKIIRGDSSVEFSQGLSVLNRHLATSVSIYPRLRISALMLRSEDSPKRRDNSSSGEILNRVLRKARKTFTPFGGDDRDSTGEIGDFVKQLSLQVWRNPTYHYLNRLVLHTPYPLRVPRIRA